MNYCLRYTNICKSLKEVQEISIKYIEDRGLVDFMKKYSGKRIILQIDSLNFPGGEIRKLEAIRKTYPEYKFVVAMNTYKPELMKVLRNAGIDYYLGAPCHSWEFLYQLTMVDKVNDIDLSGPLAFELPKVKAFLDKLDRKVNIRITPNLLVSEYEFTDKLVQFFIRPDDINIYEPYIDILEFAGIEHQDTFYNIYAKEKKFYGNLNQVIYNFSAAIDNKALIPAFGERRLSCGRECLKGGRCRRCYNLTNIAEKMSPLITEQIKKNIKKQIKDKSSENK